MADQIADRRAAKFSEVVKGAAIFNCPVLTNGKPLDPSTRILHKDDGDHTSRLRNSWEIPFVPLMLPWSHLFLNAFHTVRRCLAAKPVHRHTCFSGRRQTVRVAMSKIDVVLPYEAQYVGHREAEKRRRATKEWLRQRERELAECAPPLVPEDTPKAEKV
jgi:hypothetical protein